MGLFTPKRKERIPEVPQTEQPYSAQAASSRPALSYTSYQSSIYRSSTPSSHGSESFGGGSFAAPPAPAQRPQYGQQGTADSYGSQFSRSRGAISRAPAYSAAGAREELLRGAPPPRPPQSGQFGGGGDDAQSKQQEMDEEEEVEGIKQQMRFVKQESLASTRNAVRIAREAEETARATLDKLGDQSDRFASTENHLDLAKAHHSRAVDETTNLEALNRSIFRPNMTWNKAQKRDKEEQRLRARHNSEQEEREETRREQFESRQRIEETYRGLDRATGDAQVQGAKARAQGRSNGRQRYQFEATESDEEVEDEIDENLNELGSLAGRLKTLAVTAGKQVDAQNQRLGVITAKVDELDPKLVRATRRLERIK